MNAKQKYLTKKEKLIIGLCSLGQFLVVLDASIVNIALPALKQQFEIGSHTLQWIVNIYTILFASLLLVGGVLSDSFGSKKILTAGAIIFGSVSLLAGFSQSEETLIAYRAIQGASAGLIAPSTLSIIASTFSNNKVLKGKAFGIWGATASAGGAVGVILGGAITEWLSWSWVFWINVPLVLILLLLVQNSPLEEQRTKQHIIAMRSVAVVLLAACALMVFIYSALLLSHNDSQLSHGLLGFSIAILLIYIFWKMQRLLPDPVIPPSLLKSPSVVLGNITALVSSGSIFSTYYFLTIQMQGMLNFSPVEIGLNYLPMTIMMFISARLAGSYLLSKLGSHFLNSLGLFIAGIGLLLLGLASFLEETNVPIIIFTTLLIGIGQGIITTSSSMIATTGIDWKYYGVASGLVNTSRQVGGAMLLGSIVAMVSGLYGGEMFNNSRSYSLAFLLAGILPAALAIIFFLVALFTPKKKHEEIDGGK